MKYFEKKDFLSLLNGPFAERRLLVLNLFSGNFHYISDKIHKRARIKIKFAEIRAETTRHTRFGLWSNIAQSCDIWFPCHEFSNFLRKALRL